MILASRARSRQNHFPQRYPARSPSPRTSTMFQSFNSSAVAAQPTPWPAQRPADEARALITRYPNLSETELARLINLYRELSALDTALMLSDEKIAPNLDR